MLLLRDALADKGCIGMEASVFLLLSRLGRADDDLDVWRCLCTAGIVGVGQLFDLEQRFDDDLLRYSCEIARALRPCVLILSALRSALGALRSHLLL